MRHRPELAFVPASYQRLVYLTGQFGLQPLGRHALGVVHHKLQHARHGQRQLDLATVAQAVPRSPVAQRRPVAGQGVLRFAFAQQILHGAARDIVQCGRLQGRGGSKQRQIHGMQWL